MKEIFKAYFGKEIKEIEKEVRDEAAKQAKNLISISLGQEKKTHLLSLSRKKIAFLKTLINQKKFREKEPVSTEIFSVGRESGI